MNMINEMFRIDNKNNIKLIKVNGIYHKLMFLFRCQAHTKSKIILS